MDRPYATYSRSGTTGRSGGYADVEDDSVDYDSYDSDGFRAYEDEDGYEYDDVYEYEDPIDRRWIWVAGVAGAILLIAVICTVVILGGGDSGSVSKTVAPPAPTTTQAQDAVTPTVAPPVLTSAAPPPAPIAPLSPETVTTLAPSPPTASVLPPVAAPAPVPTDAAAAPSPQTITYMVTGTRQLLDMVTVVYTDSQGALQTEFNVALPWVRTVTLDPGVQLKSVIATSLSGSLNCAVTDANGQTIVAQTTNSMIATCTK